MIKYQNKLGIDTSVFSHRTHWNEFMSDLEICSLPSVSDTVNVTLHFSKQKIGFITSFRFPVYLIYNIQHI